MKKLVMIVGLACAAITQSFAGWGYDSNGNYYNFYRNGNSTWGYDSQGTYYITTGTATILGATTTGAITTITTATN
jgi:hypothetical protein